MTEAPSATGEPPPPRPLKLALLQYPIEPLAGVTDWTGKLDRWLAEAKENGADLAVLPEYAPVELGAAYAGEYPPGVGSELAVMRAMTAEILEALAWLARRHGLWLLGGSIPVDAGDGRVVNRAHLFSPEGTMGWQEKHVMTRFEREHWMIDPGAPPRVFDTPFGTIGIAICYDAEFPLLVRAQVLAGAWLVLVPSCTDSLHGYWRVMIACQARAMENQCYVAMAPTVGDAPFSHALDVNRGAAAVCGPVDRGFPEDGVIALGVIDQPGWVFADLDPARLDAVRRDGAVLNHADWPEPPPVPERVAFGLSPTPDQQPDTRSQA